MSLPSSSSNDSKTVPSSRLRVPIRIHPRSSTTSLSSSVVSSQDLDHDPMQPVPYNEAPRMRSGSIASLQLGFLNLLRRRTYSVSSSFDANSLNRAPTTYSVKEIYGEMAEDDIRLRRSATRNTILTTLSQRVYAEEQRDEEKLPQRQILGLYDDVPDVSVPVKDYGSEFNAVDPELVTWDGDDDPNFARNWSVGKKTYQTVVVGLYALLSPMSSSILSPAMTEIAETLHIESLFMRLFAVSVMVLAWALGPLLIAPLSESDRVGRAPVLNISVWVNGFFLLGCGFAKTTAQLCIFRFLGGLGGCAALNVGAGALADMWSDEQRNMAMAMYSIGPTLGPVIAPVISSFIVTGLNWRWCFYVLAIFNTAIAVLGTLTFRETYSPRLLKIKANMLRKETGNSHLHTIFEIADGETAWGQFAVTVTRPIKLIVTHPMVAGLGSFMAFVYGFMYLMIVTFPEVFRGVYGFSVNISGLMYLPMGIAYTIGTVFWSWMMEVVYRKLTAKNGGVSKPEYRLPCLCFSGIGIPIGLVWYGWLAQKELHWIMPCIGTGIFAFLMVAVFQSIQNYLIDMNNRFAASSVAAAAVFRSMFGFAFPLFATPMYAKLNYGWGNTMCAFMALALGIPFPIICLIYGEHIRGWANRRMEALQARRDVRNLERLRQMNADQTSMEDKEEKEKNMEKTEVS